MAARYLALMVFDSGRMGFMVDLIEFDVQNLCWFMIVVDYTTQYIGNCNQPIEDVIVFCCFLVVTKTIIPILSCAKLDDGSGLFLRIRQGSCFWFTFR